MSDMYGKGKKGTATRLHSKVIRMIGMCERCLDENYEKLQAAHIISRKYNSTRTDLRNAFCLCASCHRFFTDHPTEFGNFVRSRVGSEGYKLIYQKSLVTQKGTDAFWQDRIDFLKDVAERVQEGELTIQEARLYES